MIQSDSSALVDPGPQMDCEGCVGISNAFCVANDDVSAFTARINSRRRFRKRYNRSVSMVKLAYCVLEVTRVHFSYVPLTIDRDLYCTGLPMWA